MSAPTWADVAELKLTAEYLSDTAWELLERAEYLEVHEASSYGPLEAAALKMASQAVYARLREFYAELDAAREAVYAGQEAAEVRP